MREFNGIDLRHDFKQRTNLAPAIVLGDPIVVGDRGQGTKSGVKK